MNVPSRIAALRKTMVAHNIDAIIIPSSDPHQSEYIAEHWQERVWISGFTGSAGLVAVTKDHAGLWTDSRYFLQGEMELKGTGVELHKMLNQFGTPYIDFLAENLSKGSRVAVNGLMFSKAVVDTMKKSFAQSGIDLVYNLDLISEIWTNRPPLSDAPIFYHDEKFSGSTIADKFEQIRTTLKDNRADYHLITTLDDIAWTFNIRGNDVMYNPVSVAYAIVGKSDAHIFVNEKKLSDQVKKQFSKNNIKIYPNSEIVGFLNKMKESEYILVDTQLCNQTIYDAINGKIIQGNSIPKFLKAIKNGTEIGHIRNVMKKDGAALANTFYWLEQCLSSGQKINEVDVARKLAEHRSQQKFYQGESFGAIIGYNENGAIIHYHPEPETCKTIKPEGILLVDSGGQYSDGTTDITRTFTLSQPTEEQVKAYTLILKGMIALSMTKFPEGTTGGQLDTLARQFLWAEGMNYGHGTGHGVGFFLNVHEPPQGFTPLSSERSRTVQQPGMLTSNEPGYYKEAGFGMRIENLIITVKSEKPGFLEFETVTLYPLEHKLIDKSRLSKEEIAWINQYHKLVYAGCAPLLKGEIKTWFKDKCRKV